MSNHCRIWLKEKWFLNTARLRQRVQQDMHSTIYNCCIHHKPNSNKFTQMPSTHRKHQRQYTITTNIANNTTIISSSSITNEAKIIDLNSTTTTTRSTIRRNNSCRRFHPISKSTSLTVRNGLRNRILPVTHAAGLKLTSRRNRRQHTKPVRRKIKRCWANHRPQYQSLTRPLVKDSYTINYLI